MSRSARPPPDPDGILAAKLTGTARYHAKRRDLTPDEHATAVTELRELAAGRTDLLAELAGLLIGGSEHTINAPIKRCAADLLIAPAPTPPSSRTWIEEGRSKPDHGPGPAPQTDPSPSQPTASPRSCVHGTRSPASVFNWST
ncbi:MAG TPA: hypothetical protein VN961_11370 [Streptosporangiaceae bacterium]|nr:hypothetical protein [Streptosporangiaceae bacterium]